MLNSMCLPLVGVEYLQIVNSWQKVGSLYSNYSELELVFHVLDVPTPKHGQTSAAPPRPPLAWSCALYNSVVYTIAWIDQRNETNMPSLKHYITLLYTTYRRTFSMPTSYQ